MKTFNASNKLKSSKELFEQRVKFNTEAYLDIENTKGVVDFYFFEKIRYGHVNTESVPVIPKEEFLQPILYSEQISGLAFDFCIYGIEQILKHFKDCLRYGIINKDLITRIEPLESYKPPALAYREGLKLNFQNFNDYLEENYLNSKITDFESYVKMFMDFYKKNYKSMRPMTLSAHCLSSHSSPLETGLAIKLFPTVFDDDQKKYDDLISSPNFQKYVNACRNFGFSIVKNTPNLIIYDINSPANSIPLSKNNISSAENLFETRYQTPTNITLQIIQDEMVSGFNEYAFENPYTLHVKECNLRGYRYTCTTIQEDIACDDNLIYNMNLLSIVRGHDNSYINNNILNIYNTFRYYEEQERMSIGKFQQINKNINYFQKRFDKSSVISYIEDEYKNLYKNEPNNYVSFLIKEKLRALEQLEKETLADLTNTLVEIDTDTRLDTSSGVTTGDASTSPSQPTGGGTY